MKKYFKRLQSIITAKAKRDEQIKAGERWDSIVEELRNRK